MSPRPSPSWRYADDRGEESLLYEQARRQYTEQELVSLMLAVAAMSGWNPFAISFRTVPGTYQASASVTSATMLGKRKGHARSHAIRCFPG